MTTDNARQWANLVGPQIIALLVGAFSAYMTATVTLARLDQRTEQLEAKVERLEARGDADREQLIRLETKIDYLIERSKLH